MKAGKSAQEGGRAGLQGTHSGQHTPLCGLHMRVEAAARSEGNDGNGHCDSGNGKADCPGDGVLHVDDHRHGQAAAPVDGKVEPIEERLLLQAVLQEWAASSSVKAGCAAHAATAT